MLINPIFIDFGELALFLPKETTYVKKKFPNSFATNTGTHINRHFVASQIQNKLKIAKALISFDKIYDWKIQVFIAWLKIIAQQMQISFVSNNRNLRIWNEEMDFQKMQSFSKGEFFSCFI